MPPRALGRRRLTGARTGSRSTAYLVADRNLSVTVQIGSPMSTSTSRTRRRFAAAAALSLLLVGGAAGTAAPAGANPSGGNTKKIVVCTRIAENGSVIIKCKEY